jgi:molybdate transport system substrate-binding protein
VLALVFALAVALPVALGLLAATATPAGARPEARRGATALTVSAAASLTEAFTHIGTRFERRHRGTTVTFNFASSTALVTQISSGAPADVVATADLTPMDRLVADGRVTATPVPFARNRMVIAVKPGNPERVRSVTDLADVGVVALCGASAPCGTYAASVLRKAGVTVPESRVTRGTDARTTLGAVARGDATAALVYVSDVVAAGRTVTAVAIPDADNVVAVYPIAPVAGGAGRTARAFVDFVTGPQGQRILAASGFLPA